MRFLTILGVGLYLVFFCGKVLFANELRVAIDPSARNGSIKEDFLSYQEHRFSDLGLALSVKDRTFSTSFDLEAKVKGGGLVFPSATEEINWYAYRAQHRTGFSLKQLKLRVFWYAPGGELVQEDKAKNKVTLFTSKLKLQNISSEKRLGKWRVRVFDKEKIFDDRYFEVIS